MNRSDRSTDESDNKLTQPKGDRKIKSILMNCCCGKIDDSKLMTLLKCNWCEAWSHVTCQENWIKLWNDKEGTFVCQACRDRK